jgi:hypothetical protein
LTDYGTLGILRPGGDAMPTNSIRLVALLMVALLHIAAFAQSPPDEQTQLRTFLGVDPATPVSLAQSQSLPTNKPLKIFLAIGLDSKVQEKYSKWFASWNKSEAKKLGAIETVSTIDDADVVIAHLVRLDQTTTQTVGTMIGGGGLMLSGDVAPIYNYIIIRSPEGLAVKFRDFRQFSVKYSHKTADKLWDEFKNAMKARSQTK